MYIHSLSQRYIVTPPTEGQVYSNTCTRTHTSHFSLPSPPSLLIHNIPLSPILTPQLGTCFTCKSRYSFSFSGTKRRQTSQLAEVHLTISSGAEAAKDQLVCEVGKKEREKLLNESAFSVELTTEESLALKANLSLPWNKLRIMRRY